MNGAPGNGATAVGVKFTLIRAVSAANAASVEHGERTLRGHGRQQHLDLLRPVRNQVGKIVRARIRAFEHHRTRSEDLRWIALRLEPAIAGGAAALHHRAHGCAGTHDPIGEREIEPRALA